MNNAPFRSCILKSNNTFIDATEYTNLAMSIYNLLEHNDNYFYDTRTFVGLMHG